MLVSIALRNLSRNRRRTLLSLLVISVGSAGLLLTAGFVRYSFDGLRDAIIQGGLGHFEITAVGEGGSDDPLGSPGLPPSFVGWRETRAAIESRPHVRAAGATLQFAGVVTHGDRSASFLGAAVEPDRERRMGMRVRLRNGEDLPAVEPMAGEDRTLLGVGLARALAAEPGAVVTILIATADGSLNALDLTVAGVFSTGFQEMDDRILKTHVATAQRALGTDSVTSLVVSLDETDATHEAEADLREVLKQSRISLAIRDWEARAPFYRQVRGLYRGIFTFLGTIVAAARLAGDLEHASDVGARARPRARCAALDRDQPRPARFDAADRGAVAGAPRSARRRRHQPAVGRYHQPAGNPDAAASRRRGPDRPRARRRSRQISRAARCSWPSFSRSRRCPP